MPPIRRAVIDIGTNSVKLLVAEIRESKVCPLHERSEQTRLGQGFFDTHALRPEAIEKTARAVASFARECSAWRPEWIRVIATSAARDAVNAAVLVEAVRQASGLDLEIISGEQEADWAFAGVTSTVEHSREPLLVLDVGGGSTEFILGQGEHAVWRGSFRLGTVRLLERWALSDPPSEQEQAACREWIGQCIGREIEPSLGPALRNAGFGPVRAVATGGTSTILARIHHGMTSFDRELIDSTVLSRETISEMEHRLWGMPISRRRALPGLPANRADVILMGVSIFARIMAMFDFSEIRVSTRGLRFAAVMRSPGGV